MLICMKKKTIYIDMDNTLANYAKGAEEKGIAPKEAKHIEGFFRDLEPMEDAIESYDELSKHFDLYILTTAPWSNPHSLVEKVEWVKEHLPKAYKNIIFSHHKDLNVGDYIIDDSTKNGVANFNGEHIQIGSEKFPDWKTVTQYILSKENI